MTANITISIINIDESDAVFTSEDSVKITTAIARNIPAELSEGNPSGISQLTFKGERYRVYWQAEINGYMAAVEYIDSKSKDIIEHLCKVRDQ